MEKKRMGIGIDFADSEYRSFQMSEDASLTIYLNSWDAKTLRIVFSHVIQFSYKLASDPQSLYELVNHPFLNESLMEIYGRIPPNDKFKFFQFEDIDDFPFIQLIAESVSIFKE